MGVTAPIPLKNVGCGVGSPEMAETMTSIVSMQSVARKKEMSESVNIAI